MVITPQAAGAKRKAEFVLEMCQALYRADKKEGLHHCNSPFSIALYLWW